MGTQLIHAVIDGILTGGVYALMAAGLTLIFGVMDIINIAQGILVVLGAYLSYVLSVHLGLDLFVGLAVTIPALFVVGIVVEWAFMRRLRERERTAMSILVTYAVALIIEGILSIVFGANYVQLHAWYVDRSLHVLGFYLPYIYLFGFALAAVLLGALYATALPDPIRCERAGVAAGPHRGAPRRDRRQARLDDLLRYRRRGDGGGGHGLRCDERLQPEHAATTSSRGCSPSSILGGLGSIGGALGAAVLMLVLEDVVAVVWSPVWSTVVFFAVLVVVLSIRPVGLFGRGVARAQ